MYVVIDAFIRFILVRTLVGVTRNIFSPWWGSHFMRRSVPNFNPPLPPAPQLPGTSGVVQIPAPPDPKKAVQIPYPSAELVDQMPQTLFGNWFIYIFKSILFLPSKTLQSLWRPSLVTQSLTNWAFFSLNFNIHGSGITLFRRTRRKVHSNLTLRFKFPIPHR